jgi:hypothetical protein
MNSVFVDIHIHTSVDPNNLDKNYDLDVLKKKIERIAEGSEYLISFSDHNTVNKEVYLRAREIFENLIIGAEIHVKNYDNADAYHCHILFSNPVEPATIDEINLKLDELYPIKVIEKKDDCIPMIGKIMNCFDEYDFILLPHGGQNHSTFNKSIPAGVHFDTTLERSVYYNHFDGFTARSNKGLDETHLYFNRLGINEFVNLLTSTDNYNPDKYPECKSGKEAAEFIPTWMLASPTFDGLRLSLSEESRLKYGKKPDLWAEFLKRGFLKNENIDIDVNFTLGLNVVIGGSSSGKSLLVDSIYRKIEEDFDGSVYSKYGVKELEIENPSNQHPYYLDQNYISKICDPKNTETEIDDIKILKRLFPSDEEERDAIANGLSNLNKHLTNMVLSVREIESLQERLKKIPALSHLITKNVINGNPLRQIAPEENIDDIIRYGDEKLKEDIKRLYELDSFLLENPLVKHDNDLILKLKEELFLANKNSRIEETIRGIVREYKNIIDEEHENENREITTKRKQFEDLLDIVKCYKRYKSKFEESMNEILNSNISIETRTVESMEHKLFIKNEFQLTEDKFLDVVNDMLKSQYKIESFEKITPEAFFESKFSKKDPKVLNYDDFQKKIYNKFNSMNKKKYSIKTKDNRDFESLSAGWKTSIILDLILGWSGDNAPLIIDQPEDNLATGYINKGLLKAIKNCKLKRQIILVTHNATIPMLGDAQNIIMCKNDANVIRIRSNPLEGSIDGSSVVDLIAEITDGGKASIKKRVKKYNLKKFRG